MSTARNQDNSVGLATVIAAESNPYLTPVANDQQKSGTDSDNGLDEEAQAEEALFRAEDEKNRKRRRHRWIALAFILTLLTASVGFAVRLYRRHSTTVEYAQTAKQSGVLPPSPNVAATTSRDNRHEQAIQDALRLTNEGNTTDRKEQGAANAASSVATQTAHSSANKTESPFVWPDSAADASNRTEGTQKDSTAPVSTNDQRSLRSQRNSEISLYVGEQNDERIQPARNSERSMTKSGTPKDEKPEITVVTPPFGSVLPVRAIGGLYTLRSGALARFELTRDLIGNGWSMKRGTILVGTTKGGEYDRAYVSIIGFIDPQSGKLVKLGGDVLGGDGAAGLKGKSRQLDSRWVRVLGQVGNAALTLGGALLGGRSNGTVIISDGARSPLINPISDELSGVLGSQSDRNRRSQFVEVVAGTPGYVMVTDLPAAIKGTEANGALDEQTVAALADIDATRSATGISEREFAELLANGSPDEIRARLPRMSPEMRKIALAVMGR